MNREDRKRLARRQRMLAREQGRTSGPVPGTSGSIGLQTPRRVQRGRPAAPAAPEPENPHLRPLAPIKRRRQKRRMLVLAALVLLLALGFALLSGAFSGSLALLGDAMDTFTIYASREGGSWPANTGIEVPKQIEPLAGGFVELDAEDVVVYSSYGGRLRAVQPGYARPVITTGNARFLVYNRGGAELRVESRTRTLYTASFENPLLLASVSNNGTVAAVTSSARYAAELYVYDPGFRELLTWRMTGAEGTPIALAFSTDNRRLAVGTLAARSGQMASTVTLLDLRGEDQPVYTATTGSTLLRLQWMGRDRLLAVFDNYLTLLDTARMTETARYDIGGGTLQSVSVSGRQTALLLNVRGTNTLVTLDESLTPLAEIPAGQATAITAAQTGVYLVCADRVQFYGYDGVQRWEHLCDTTPQAVLNTGSNVLLFTGTTARVLTGP